MAARSRKKPMRVQNLTSHPSRKSRDEWGTRTFVGRLGDRNTERSSQRSAPRLNHTGELRLPQIIPRGGALYGRLWPRVASAVFMPSAAELRGSSRSAFDTSEADAGSWFAWSSIRASTRYAATLGASFSEACASVRASSEDPLRSRTCAIPACAEAFFGFAESAVWNSCSASGISPCARYWVPSWEYWTACSAGGSVAI